MIMVSMVMMRMVMVVSGMTMVGMIMMGVVMPGVVMARLRRYISAAFGFKSRLNFNNLGTQSFGKFGNVRVMAHTQLRA